MTVDSCPREGVRSNAVALAVGQGLQIPVKVCALKCPRGLPLGI